MASTPTSPSNSQSDDEARTRAYSRARRLIFVTGILFSVVASAAMVFTGTSAKIARASERRIDHSGVAETATISLFLLLSWFASLPLAYVRSYWLEHRYQLSNQTRFSWLGERLKGLALELALAVPIARVALAVIRRRQRDWWLVLSAAAIPFSVILSQLAPVLIFPLFNTYRPLRDQQLAERLKALAGRSGIEVAEVLEVDTSRQTKKANAFFAGLGRTKRIVLSDTLLEEFTAEQIETVVAHEIGHQAHGDIWRLLAIGSITMAAIAYSTQRLTEAVLSSNIARRAGLRSAVDPATLPLLGLAGSIAGLVLAPLQSAYSRHREREADTFALELTDNPGAFAASLRKLAEMNLTETDPPRLEHLLLHSHPTIAERIARCEEYARRI